jgi:hypothetical protein
MRNQKEDKLNFERTALMGKNSDSGWRSGYAPGGLTDPWRRLVRWAMAGPAAGLYTRRLKGRPRSVAGLADLEIGWISAQVDRE